MRIIHSGLRSPMIIVAFAALALSSAQSVATEAVHGEVSLNHFYVVLDEATYAALLASPFFVERFANVDTGLPKFEAPLPSSQRMYVRGRSTYVELLGPQNPFGEPVGKVGIALGVDDRKWLGEVQRAWSALEGGKVEHIRKDWTRSSPHVPWYDVVLHPATSSNDRLVLWLTAYAPDFLPWLYPQRSALENGVSRAAYLAPRFAADRVMADVTGVSIAVPPELAERIARQLAAVGYTQRREQGGLVLEGGGWSLTLLDPAEGRTGLLGVDFSTNCPQGTLKPISYGPRSALTFGPGCTAQWRFGKVDS